MTTVIVRWDGHPSHYARRAVPDGMTAWEYADHLAGGDHTAITYATAQGEPVVHYGRNRRQP